MEQAQELAGADAALCRPFRRHLHAWRCSHRPWRWCSLAPTLAGWTWMQAVYKALVLVIAFALRAGDLTTPR
ncbi:MAG: hypothetical protein IPG91_10240 [Ideonella sp.]|nr:hypothetical protein [Ideonella sp.]